MVIPFGVSVGDFIATLGVIREIIAALNDTHGSASKLRALIERLDSVKGALEAAVEEFENLEWQEETFATRLKKTTQKLKASIAAFHERIAKCHPALKLGSGLEKWKGAFRKVQFTFIKEDVTRLEVELLVHMESLQLLLDSARAAAFRDMKRRMIAAEAKLE